MHCQPFVEIIDLEEDGVAIDLERPEVVLLVRVVGMTKSSNKAMVLTIRPPGPKPRCRVS
jgi:hypothetical protein